MKKIIYRQYGVFFIIVGLVLFYFSTKIDPGFHSGPIGTAAFPKIIGIIFSISGLWLLFSKSYDLIEFLNRKQLLKVFYFFISILFFISFITSLGFIIANTTSQLIISRILGASWKRSFLVGLASSLAIFVLFDWILNINLSLGKLYEFFLEGVDE